MPESSQDGVIRLKVGDGEYEIDVYNLEIGEQIELEEHFEMPIARIFGDGWMLGSARAMRFLGYLARRRKEPEFRLDQVASVEGVERKEEDGEKRPTKRRKTSGARSTASS